MPKYSHHGTAAAMRQAHSSVGQWKLSVLHLCPWHPLIELQGPKGCRLSSLIAGSCAILDLLLPSRIDRQLQTIPFIQEMLLIMLMLLLSCLAYPYVVPCPVANPAPVAEEGCGQLAHFTIDRCRPQDAEAKPQAETKSRRSPRHSKLRHRIIRSWASVVAPRCLCLRRLQSTICTCS